VEDASPSDVRQQVMAASAALAVAIVSNDADRIAGCLGDEWRLVDQDGVTTRAHFLDVVRSGALTHSMMRAVGDVDVRAYDDVAVVLARVVNTAHFGGNTFQADEWTTDVFARRDGRWVCVHSHVSTAHPEPSGD
jgi:ketosteroid isomerase-like protein